MSLTLILLVVIQLALVFVVNRFFNNDTREDIQTMAEELSAKGMPPEQVRALTSNLSMIRVNVSYYVNTVATFIIMANGSFLYGVIRKSNQDDSSQ